MVPLGHPHYRGSVGHPFSGFSVPSLHLKEAAQSGLITSVRWGGGQRTYTSQGGGILLPQSPGCQGGGQSYLSIVNEARTSALLP